MPARLVAVTKPIIELQPGMEMTPEGLIAYCARVSSEHQDNPEYDKLLRYCAKHRHWSIFEMADMVIEISTSRAIAAQILRHRSFSFQEFSQRYAKIEGYVDVEPRRQDVKNRQNSIADLPEETQQWWEAQQEQLAAQAFQVYEEALDKGIAKECARFLLPLSTATKLYMKGSIRSWIHYLEVRTDPGTQKEHREIAEACKKIFCDQFPVIAKALGWGQEEALSAA